ncbi:hypothetical protein OHA79_03595 [Streptomyces sp. NBC_00841]|uniref:hypothetical protein n=1 Tax=Streptomyces sp. NBC_00841 TaxID=2975847 RepID=UPI002DDC6AAB|nr:hypothetical protein [Streptomyces sp. NBC_00841]WSA04702.1 hypothetical protein OHA79_03595 [Streptomyces sp. NBC_00841]
MDRLVRALGARPGDLADAPVQIVSTVHSKVLVGFRTREVVDALGPDSAALTELRCAGLLVLDDRAADGSQFRAPQSGA